MLTTAPQRGRLRSREGPDPMPTAPTWRNRGLAVSPRPVAEVGGPRVLALLKAGRTELLVPPVPRLQNRGTEAL